jgi:hypothetical protein
MTTDPRDAAQVELILAELRLPAIRRLWAGLAGQADKEGWPAARFLASLAEHEVAERGRRRSSATSPKPGYRSVRPSTALTLTPCR